MVVLALMVLSRMAEVVFSSRRVRLYRMGGLLAGIVKSYCCMGYMQYETYAMINFVLCTVRPT